MQKTTTSKKKVNLKKERTLLGRCLQGDKKAWDEFVSTYSKLIYNSIYRALELRGYELEPDLVEDMHNEVFLLFLENDYSKLRRFKWKNNSSLATWIAVVARNFVLDYIRKESKKRAITQSANEPMSDDNSAEVIDSISDDKVLIWQVMSGEETEAALNKAITELPESDKELVGLLFFQELPIEAISSLVGKTRDAIYMQKKRLIEKLSEKIKKLC